MKLREGTLPSFNINTKNDGLENVSPFKCGYFGVSILDFKGLDTLQLNQRKITRNQ